MRRPMRASECHGPTCWNKMQRNVSPHARQPITPRLSRCIKVLWQGRNLSHMATDRYNRN
eukprot:1820862-Amphidinium_carterae.1